MIAILNAIVDITMWAGYAVDCYCVALWIELVLDKLGR